MTGPKVTGPKVRGGLVVGVASGNPVKARAVRAGFEAIFSGTAIGLRTVSVPSGVSDQPMSSGETHRGAARRARAARVALPECSYWVGLEGGVEEEEHGMAAFAWAVVLSGERIGRARSGTFYLPPPVAALVREGHELGKADDIVFGRTGSKQEEGAIGLLTRGAIDRAGLYAHAVTLALVPFLHPELYPDLHSAG